jgi:hypothetical protein
VLFCQKLHHRIKKITMIMLGVGIQVVDNVLFDNHGQRLLPNVMLIQYLGEQKTCIDFLLNKRRHKKTKNKVTRESKTPPPKGGGRKKRPQKTAEEKRLV